MKVLVIMFLLELGDGWGPAFASDIVELELFREKEKSLTDNSSFWIGGMGHKSVESQGYSEGKFCQISKISQKY